MANKKGKLYMARSVITVYRDMKASTRWRTLDYGIKLYATPVKKTTWYKIDGFKSNVDGADKIIGCYVQKNGLTEVSSSEKKATPDVILKIPEVDSDAVKIVGRTTDTCPIYNYTGKLEAGEVFDDRKINSTGRDYIVNEKLDVFLVTSDLQYACVRPQSYKVKKTDNPNKGKVFIPYSKLVINPSKSIIESLKKMFTQRKADLKDVKQDIKSIAKTAGKMDQASGMRTASTSAKRLAIGSSQGIHGMPYQFLPWVDVRVRSLSGGSTLKDLQEQTVTMSGFGSVYAEKIVERMPLVLISPGEPDFLPTYTKKESIKAVQGLADLSAGKKADLDKILNKTGTYYSFRFNYTDYYKYVNSVLRQMAIYLNIGSYKHKCGTTSIKNGKAVTDSEKLENYDWAKAVNSYVTGYTCPQEYVCFYADAQTTVSESASNSITDSPFANTFNNFSSLAKEVRYLAGPIAGAKIEAVNKDKFNKSIENIKDITRSMTGNSKFINNIMEGFSTLAKGGSLIFPKIWGDSEFSKSSFTLDLTLRCPNPDKISWFLDIAVPMMHAYCLTLARSTGPNSYNAPFLCRVFQKGVYSSDMAFVNSMNVSLGKECGWTVDGLPTEVDISLSFVDLYDTMAMTSTSGGIGNGIGEFLQNTAYIDFIANRCGVNINKPDISRVIQNYWILIKNGFADAFTNRWRDIENDLSNFTMKGYKKIFKA